MKAEAPEKIYIADTTFPNYVDFDGSPINTKRISDSDIEYVRSDIFVGKYDVEDNNIRNKLIEAVTSIKSGESPWFVSDKETCDKVLAWLYKENKTNWKPSKKQLDALNDILDVLKNTERFNSYLFYVLEELKNELKKL